MASDALIKGFFWLIIIIGILAVAGIYWLFVVVLPAILTIIIFLYQSRTRKKTLENLKLRPDTELDRDPVNKDFASYSGEAVELVELDKYRENHQAIATEAQVSKASTLPINGGVYAFSKSTHSGPTEISDVVLLACVDWAVVGEVRAIETEKVAREVLSTGGAAKVVLNTKFKADGTVREIKMHPFSGDW